MTEPCRLSAFAAASGIAEGTLSSERLVRSCIERIHEREGTVRAWEHFDPHHALEQARRRDRGASKGLLHGLPVGVKDVLDTVDMPTVWGDAATFGDRRPHRNAPVVQRLREEHAVLLGKTAVSRFGFWWPGKARNPHNPEHTPGSSSSGSAAAVADCMCPLSIGTQTEGSIMRPAAFCGVVGLVPTRGWLAWRNSRDYAPTLDVVGGFGRSVQDMLFLMRGLTGRPAFDPEAAHDGTLTIGLYRTTDWPKAPHYTQAMFEQTAGALAAAGCHVREVKLPETFERLEASQEVVITYESARSFEWEMTRRRETVEPGLVELLEQGLAFTREQYLAALDHGAQCRRSFAGAIGDVDLLMCPGALGEAPKAASTGHNEFIRMWNLLRVPSLALPVGTGPSGLPLGVQLIGRQGDDARHLVRARKVEKLLGPRR